MHASWLGHGSAVQFQVFAFARASALNGCPRGARGVRGAESVPRAVKWVGVTAASRAQQRWPGALVLGIWPVASCSSGCGGASHQVEVLGRGPAALYRALMARCVQPHPGPAPLGCIRGVELQVLARKGAGSTSRLLAVRCVVMGSGVVILVMPCSAYASRGLSQTDVWMTTWLGRDCGGQQQLKQ